MKRIVTLLLTILLCVALCACGNKQEKLEQARREAMAKWPWLMGEWYTPFGEKVLFFGEDGSFRFEGEPGTWIWDPERGGRADYVELTVDLENGESYLLDFILEGDSWKRVMMQNRETQEYNDVGDYLPGVGEGEVRTGERIAADREKASNLFGQWYSSENEANHPADEPFMHIREDGTCMIFGEEGVWGLSNNQKDLEEVDYLLIKTPTQNYGIQIDSLFDDGYRILFVHTLSFEGAESVRFDYAVNSQ